MAGDNEYSNWKDGKPVVSPGSDGSFSDWKDGEPIVGEQTGAVDPQPSVYDAVSVSEDVSVSVEVLDRDIDTYDAVSVAEDVVVATDTLLANTYDEVTVSEDIAKQLASYISVADEVSLDESVAALPDLVVSVLDEVSVAEDVTTELSAVAELEISLYDEVTTAEDLSSLLVSLVAAVDEVSVSEDVSADNADLPLALHDSVVITEDITLGAGNVEQYSFIFYNDDGDEDESTEIGKENQNISLPANSKVRIRFLINALDNPEPHNFKLEYRRRGKTGTFGDWTQVE